MAMSIIIHYWLLNQSPFELQNSLHDKQVGGFNKFPFPASDDFSTKSLRLEKTLYYVHILTFVLFCTQSKIKFFAMFVGDGHPPIETLSL